LNEELIDVEQERDMLRRNLEDLEETLEHERVESVKLKATVSEEQSKNNQLQDANRRLDAELRDCKVQIMTQKGRTQRQMTLDPNNDPILKKNSEITRLAGEIQMLSTEHSNLTSDFEAVTEELEVAVTELEMNAQEITQLQSNCDINSKKVVELLDERDSYRIKLEDATEHQEEKFQTYVKKLDDIETLYQKSTQNNHEQKESIANLESRLHIQRKEIQALRERIASDEISSLKNELNEKNDMIQGLSLKLHSCESDLQLLAIEWNNLDQIVHHKSKSETLDTVKESSNTSKRQKEIIEAYKKRHKGDLAKLTDLNELQFQKEQNIIELTTRINMLESTGFGTEEARKEAKDLRIKLKIDDREIRTLAQKVTDLESQSCELAEENLLMRDKLGIELTSPIDISNLKIKNSIEIEKLKSLNATLHSEIETLEDERIDLHKKVRLQAIQVK
jgi:centrosomal protein CEP290